MCGCLWLPSAKPGLTLLVIGIDSIRHRLSDKAGGRENICPPPPRVLPEKDAECV